VVVMDVDGGGGGGGGGSGGDGCGYSSGCHGCASVWWYW